MADIFSEYLGMELHIMNIYFPCQKRAKFYEDIMRSSFSQVENIILGGDLNLSIRHADSWGNHAQIDSLLDYFVQLLEKNNLMDIFVSRLQLTWRNGRMVDAMLAR